jgi:hypothetical protein
VFDGVRRHTSSGATKDSKDGSPEGDSGSAQHSGAPPSLFAITTKGAAAITIMFGNASRRISHL